MRTTNQEIDCLDSSKGIFNQAPITTIDFMSDYFELNLLPNQTRTRMREILESKEGDAVHTEAHFVNAILLCLALANHHAKYSNAKESQTYYEKARELTLKIENPLYLGTIFLHAASALYVRTRSLTPEYYQCLEKAMTYYSEVKADNEAELFQQLVLATQPEIHPEHLQMLDKYTLERIEKTYDKKYTSLLVRMYLKKEDFKSAEDILKVAPSEVLDAELVNYLEMWGDKVRTDGRHKRNQARLFYINAVNTIITLGGNIELESRLVPIYFKLLASTNMSDNQIKDVKARIELCIKKLEGFVAENKGQTFPCPLRFADCKTINTEYSCRIFEMFPDGIIDLIHSHLSEAADYANEEDDDSMAKNYRLAIKHFAIALTKAKDILQNLKDNKLANQLFAILVKYNQSFMLEDYEGNDEEIIKAKQEIEKFPLLLTQFILEASANFPQAFSHLGAFRTEARLRYANRNGLEEKEKTAMINAIDSEVDQIVNHLHEEKQKAAMTNDNGNELAEVIKQHYYEEEAVKQIRPIIEVFLEDKVMNWPSASWSYLLASKAHEYALKVNDRKNLLKAKLKLASLYNKNNFETEGFVEVAYHSNTPDMKMGNEAKKNLLSFLECANTASSEEVRSALSIVDMSITDSIAEMRRHGMMYFNYFSDVLSNLEMAAVSANCFQAWTSLLAKYIPASSSSAMIQLRAQYCIMSMASKKSEEIPACFSEIMCVSERVFDKQKHLLFSLLTRTFFRVHFNLHTFISFKQNSQSLLESLKYIFPVFTSLEIFKRSNKSEQALPLLQHATFQLLHNYQSKSTDDLVQETQWVKEWYESWPYFQENYLTSARIAILTSLIKLLEELEKRKAAEKRITQYYISELDPKMLASSQIVAHLHLAYCQSSLNELDKGDIAFEKAKSYSKNFINVVSEP